MKPYVSCAFSFEQLLARRLVLFLSALPQMLFLSSVGAPPGRAVAGVVARRVGGAAVLAGRAGAAAAAPGAPAATCSM